MAVHSFVVRFNQSQERRQYVPLRLTPGMIRTRIPGLPGAALAAELPLHYLFTIYIKRILKMRRHGLKFPRVFCKSIDDEIRLSLTTSTRSSVSSLKFITDTFEYSVSRYFT